MLSDITNISMRLTYSDGANRRCLASQILFPINIENFSRSDVTRNAVAGKCCDQSMRVIADRTKANSHKVNYRSK